MKKSIMLYLIVGLFIIGMFLVGIFVVGSQPKSAPTSDDDAQLKALTDVIENPDITDELAVASFPHTARAIVAATPEVISLIDMGDAAAEYITPKFDDPALGNRDYALASYAYVIEVLKYVPALPVLNSFLANPQNRQTLDWSIVFAENARKALEE